MNFLHGKNIVLGITGGIAAYKSAELTRRLTELSANVRVVMTESAKSFITPLTMQAVSGNPIRDSLLDPTAEAGMGHIELAKWADIVLIAPATANTIANLATGKADELLSTICLASSAPIAVCPAMNQQMWAAKATQRNMQQLADDDYLIWGPSSGSQACGDTGFGRMIEPDEIVQFCQQLTAPKLLQNLNIVITAGPTQEAIDPVRFLSNHSSGKMGYALAQIASYLGASVSVISGPTSLSLPFKCDITTVTSCQQMLEATQVQTDTADIFISCAAVADYKIAEVEKHKIKKSAETLQLNLVKTPDVLATISARSPNLFTVGFAAETENIEHYALDKLKRKNLNMIAANNVAIKGQGFSSDKNAITAYWSDGQKHFPKADKNQIAYDLLCTIAEQYATHHSK